MRRPVRRPYARVALALASIAFIGATPAVVRRHSSAQAARAAGGAPPPPPPPGGGAGAAPPPPPRRPGDGIPRLTAGRRPGAQADNRGRRR